MTLDNDLKSNGQPQMGCGASTGRSAGDGDPPMVVVRERQRAAGPPSLTRPPLTMPSVIRTLRKGEAELKQQKHICEDSRKTNFLPQRQGEHSQLQIDFGYALGALLAVHTLKEAALREKVPEILRPAEPTDLRGVGELATVQAALKMKLECHLATVAVTHRLAKSHSALNRRITALANARLYVTTIRVASSDHKITEMTMEAESEQWHAMHEVERLRSLVVARAEAKRQAAVSEGALLFVDKYKGREEVGALMMDAELRQKYQIECIKSQEKLEEATEEATGATAAQNRLASAREKLRVIEIFKRKKPTEAQCTAAEAGLDGEICEAARAIEAVRLARAAYKHAKTKMVKCIGGLSVLGHARAVRASMWKPGHLVQRLTLDVRDYKRLLASPPPTHSNVAWAVL